MATLLEAYEAAIAGNTHIEDADGALVQAGRTVADTIDKIVADPEASATDKSKALYLIPHVVSILKELLATPAARKQFGIAAGEKKAATRLEKMKASRKK